MIGLLVALLGSAHAAPLDLLWQGRLVDPAGVAISGTEDLTVRLYADGGAVVWERTFSDVQLEQGFFAVSLGTDATGVSVAEAVEAGATEAGIQRGSAAELSPRQPFHAVPYATQASSVPTAAGLTGSGCDVVGSVAFDTSANSLVVCGNGLTWLSTGGTSASSSCAAGEVPVSGACVPCGGAAVDALAPMHFFRLDETSGSSAVNDGAGPDLTYSNITLGAASVLHEGTAASFGGSTASHASAGNFPMPTEDYTVSLWMQSTGSIDGIFSYATSIDDNDALLYNQASAEVCVNTACHVVGADLNNGTWHHVVMSRTLSTNTVVLYVDALEVWSGTLGTQALGMNGSLVLGQDQDNVGGGFDPAQAYAGVLDDVAIFDTVLSANEVARIYHGQLCQEP